MENKKKRRSWHISEDVIARIDLKRRNTKYSQAQMADLLLDKATKQKKATEPVNTSTSKK